MMFAGVRVRTAAASLRVCRSERESERKLRCGYLAWDSDGSRCTGGGKQVCRGQAHHERLRVR
jgi:hypothetical protein